MVFFNSTSWRQTLENLLFPLCAVLLGALAALYPFRNRSREPEPFRSGEWIVPLIGSLGLLTALFVGFVVLDMFAFSGKPLFLGQVLWLLLLGLSSGLWMRWAIRSAATILNHLGGSENDSSDRE